MSQVRTSDANKDCASDNGQSTELLDLEAADLNNVGGGEGITTPI